MSSWSLVGFDSSFFYFLWPFQMIHVLNILCLFKFRSSTYIYLTPRVFYPVVISIDHTLINLPSFFTNSCEPINLGMLANKTNTGNMFAVCSISTILWSVWMLSGIPCQACYAPDVINTAVAKYGVTEEVECCPVYYCCGPCSTCRAHREVRLV